MTIGQLILLIIILIIIGNIVLFRIKHGSPFQYNNRRTHNERIYIWSNINVFFEVIFMLIIGVTIEFLIFHYWNIPL